MKVLFGSIVLVTSATFVSAQDQTTPATPPQVAKIVAEVASRSASSVKNSPFSAEEVNESTQTLFDGNRIVRSSTGKIYRNSEGRIRRESSGGVSGVMGSTYSVAQGVSIAAPSLGQKYLLDSELKTARVVEMAAANQALATAGSRLSSEDEKFRVTANLKAAELAAKVTAAAPVVVQGGLATTIVGSGQGGVISYVPAGKFRYETNTEQLGTRDFDGVSAIGTRQTTTIPANAIGNERPIEIVYERWYSKELGMVVYSKNIDPRFGEQIYKLTNLVRAEPDPSLFSLPTGYKMVTEPTTTYRIPAAKASAAERALYERAATRATTAGTPVVYSKPKTVSAKPATVISPVEKVKPNN